MVPKKKLRLLKRLLSKLRLLKPPPLKCPLKPLRLKLLPLTLPPRLPTLLPRLPTLPLRLLLSNLY